MSSDGELEQVLYVHSWQYVDRGIILQCRTDQGRIVRIYVEIYSDRLIRFRLSSETEKTGNEYRKILQPLVFEDNQPLPTFDIVELDEQIEIHTQWLNIVITKAPFQFRVYNRAGKTPLWGEQRSDFNVRESLRIPSLSLYKSNGQIQKVVDSFTLSPDEHLYGFGEKFTLINKRGQRIIAWNEDALGVETERAYKNVPFFMSSKGYGVFINTTGQITHYVGYPPLSSASYVLEVEDEQLDYFLIWGPLFKDILNQYTVLTGKAPIPPKWSFGLWISRCYYHNRQIVEQVAEKMRELDIPCDVITFDSYWMRDGQLCDFLWDEERFPNPKEMINHLKGQGYKICLWEHPYVSVESELFKEGEEKGYFLVKSDGSTYIIHTGLVRASHKLEGFQGLGTAGTFGDLPPAPPVAIIDFTNPEAVEWYQDRHKILLQMGVDVFKTDFGEQVPYDAYSPYSGLTGKQLHNLYPLLYNRAVFEITREVKGRGIVWARSAWAGSQRYPVHWSGDPQTTFSSMASSLRGGLSLGLSGIPFWSHDIGGFYGKKPNPKLYIRWAQFGLLSSHARCHGTTPREPWEYGNEALRIFRTYAKLRYRLIPYLYSYAHIASRTGLPVMRPLLLEYQDDPNTYDKDLQYLLGEWILIAPLFDETDRRTVYLPRGRWVDYWTQKAYVGPRYLNYKAPIEILPLFIRTGTILPLGPEMQYIGEKPFDPITLEVYPDKDSSFTLYDDDEVVSIHCSKQDGQIALSVSESRKTYIANIRGIKCPQRIEYKGGEIHFAEDFRQAKVGWTWDDSTGLWVKCPSPPFQIIISPQKY